MNWQVESTDLSGLKEESMEIAKSGVNVVTGIDEHDQELKFTNSTLQNAGKMVSFSVATYVEIPEEIAFSGEDAVAAFLAAQLSKANRNVPCLEFDVQVGLSKDAVKQRTSNLRAAGKIFVPK